MFTLEYLPGCGREGAAASVPWILGRAGGRVLSFQGTNIWDIELLEFSLKTKYI